ncbi:hypothetical protein STEG23_013186, partial [Scotinomys teguina]
MKEGKYIEAKHKAYTLDFIVLTLIFPLFVALLGTMKGAPYSDLCKCQAGAAAPPRDSWTLVQLPVLDLRINLHPSLDKGLMTTGDPVSWAPERTTQESSGPSPPDYSSVIP